MVEGRGGGIVKKEDVRGERRQKEEKEEAVRREVAEGSREKVGEGRRSGGWSGGTEER